MNYRISLQEKSDISQKGPSGGYNKMIPWIFSHGKIISSKEPSRPEKPYHGYLVYLYYLCKDVFSQSSWSGCMQLWQSATASILDINFLIQDLQNHLSLNVFLDRSLEAIRERLICRTDDLFGVCRTADILVVAVGRFLQNIAKGTTDPSVEFWLPK